MAQTVNADTIPTLTGAVEFSSTSSGDWGHEVLWNTVGGDAPYNLYVTTPNTGISGAFLNSGNGSETSLNVALPQGTYQFFMFGEPGADRSHFALNLFFDGNNVTPGISVFAEMDTAPSPPFPAFTANSSPITADLAGINFVPGSGSLVYSSGLFTVALTDYRWSTPAVDGLDRVGPNSVGEDFYPDYVGSFTLEVTAVPEPSSLMLLGTGFLCLCSYGWRRRKQVVKRIGLGWRALVNPAGRVAA